MASFIHWFWGTRSAVGVRRVANTSIERCFYTSRCLLRAWVILAPAILTTRGTRGIVIDSRSGGKGPSYIATFSIFLRVYGHLVGRRRVINTLIRERFGAF